MLVGHIVISRESIRNSDVYAVIESDISVANYLPERGTKLGGLSPDVLGSYYVDYYLVEIMNGGISQLMFNRNDDHQILDHIIYALPLPGATRYAGLFSEVRAGWDTMDAKEKRMFFNGGFFNPPNPSEGISDRAYGLNDSEDLVEPDPAFVRNHPNLEVTRLRRLEVHLAGTTRIISDLAAQLAERERLTKEDKPRCARIIDVVREEYGMELMYITAGDSGFIHKGEERVTRYFLTDHGHYSMVDMGKRAVMFNNGGDKIAVVNIARVPTG